jgi:Immunoglobulin-like domain of bacterial spore germination
MSTHISQKERGNAVTLTLLGLSVAILAGVTVLYFIGETNHQQVYIPQTIEEQSTELTSEEEKPNPRLGWNTFVSEEYEFSFEYPSGWVVATGTLETGEPVVTTYPVTGTSTDEVFRPDIPVSHVSVYPLGTNEFTFNDVMNTSNVIIEVPQASAKDYVLESKRPWATKAWFDARPASWSEVGFVFARVRIEEEQNSFTRGDTNITQSEYDPQKGDVFSRSGFIDIRLREIEEEILRSFRFLDSDREEPVGVNDVTVLEPEANTLITSPLEIRGELEGGWYFGNEMTVRLTTSEGKVLTEGLLAGLEEWNGQDTLPFEISLVFETPTATSGVLSIVKEIETVGAGETKIQIPVLFTEDVVE